MAYVYLARLSDQEAAGLAQELRDQEKNLERSNAKIEEIKQELDRLDEELKALVQCADILSIRCAAHLSNEIDHRREKKARLKKGLEKQCVLHTMANERIVVLRWHYLYNPEMRRAFSDIRYKEKRLS